MKSFRLSAWITAFGIFVAASSAGAGDPRRDGGPSEAAPQAGICQGYFNTVDPASGTMVIDDRIFTFSPSQLIVRSNGRLSNLNALRPNQEIRYACPLAAANSTAERKTVTEIWVDTK